MKWTLLALLCLSLFCVAQNQPADTSAPPSGMIDGNDPLLQPAPLPAGSPSLIGGTVLKVDGVKNTLQVRPFGGKSLKVYFDDRTHIFRNGIETTQLGVRKDDRVYIDTLVDGGRVFAKSIRVENQSRLADARGRLLHFDRRNGRLSMLDELSSQPVSFRVDANTQIRNGDQTVAVSSLLPNSLIGVHFAPDALDRGIARQITIYAAPGSSFTFAGRLTFLDMKSGILAVQNQTDHRSYEIHFDPQGSEYSALTVGTAVNIDATFDGDRYNVRSLRINRAE